MKGCGLCDRRKPHRRQYRRPPAGDRKRGASLDFPLRGGHVHRLSQILKRIMGLALVCLAGGPVVERRKRAKEQKSLIMSKQTGAGGTIDKDERAEEELELDRSDVTTLAPGPPGQTWKASDHQRQICLGTRQVITSQRQLPFLGASAGRRTVHVRQPKG